MAVMRRSTSAISLSDAPDFKTMIMTVSLRGTLAGCPGPLRWFNAKRPRARRPRPRRGHRRGRSVRPRLPDSLGQSRWADLGEVEKPEAEPPDRGPHVRVEHATEPARLLSSAFAAPEPGEDALPVVVERQAEGGDDGDEGDGVDVLLVADVGAEVRRDPRARDPPHRRHHREDPEGHRAHAEQVGDDVLREAGDQIEDEADDGALGLDDEVHLLPVVLAEPGADERLAPQPPEREAHQGAG